MKVLVVGGGGREHALVWKLKQSRLVDEVCCAPGNGGIAAIAHCENINAMDIEAMVDYAKKEGFSLVVVAPDDPLAAGMVDAMEAADIKAFGPNKAAARIEASKSFSKQLMQKYGIPTAAYAVFDEYDKAIEYLSNQSYPLVVKADGLALGKGVIICDNIDEATAAVFSMMRGGAFGAAGSRVVIEEFLEGPEVSVLAFTDGKTCLPMISAQDHKRALDGDKGPNTGGMGAFAPSPKYTSDIMKTVERDIIFPTVEAMNSEGCRFKGVIYFGLMLTKDGPKVLEYNARFGDPEAQAVLPMLENDIAEVMLAVIDERLEDITLKWRTGAAVCVVMASRGYPGEYEKGLPISGIEDAGLVFHAGTRLEEGRYYTNGGRVLAVSAMGDDISGARAAAYDALSRISFEGAQFRTDIGLK
ncbi:MAG: phosphoribosylamine--glycine ligase [Christensenellales bacterium]|jgi:phosphoribosylamine--glycine ligase